eukprot:tig00000852_g5036.t1
MSVSPASNLGIVFVRRALERLLNQAAKKQVELRDACSAALAASDPKNHAEGIPHEEITAEKHFLPFKMACESKSTKLMETALDALQKMISYGFLSTAGKTERRFVDAVIETICNCFDHPDDGVQLQILKALLTAVTSSSFELHEQSLLLTVRTCYNIFLVSKNPVNQTTARATLTQMLNIIFSRMEQQSAPTSSRTSAADSMNRVPSGQELSSDSARTREDGASSVPAPSPVPTETDSTVSLGVCVVCGKPATFACEQTQQSMCSMACKAKNLETFHKNQSALFHSGKKSSTAGDSTADDFGATEPANGFANVQQKDGFLLFRALCKLSMKPLPEGNTPDSVPLRSKLLSLELLQTVLENAGPTFRSGEKFIQAVKQYLVLSLLKNCVYNIPQVFQLSLSIFQALLTHFKEHLKTEVGVFFTNIFLRILESPAMAVQQKLIVMAVLQRICQEPQTVVDIFLNYDCDLEALDIFERMVNDLSKIAQTKVDPEKAEVAPAEVELKVAGLRGLVAILKSMVDWSSRSPAPDAPHDMERSESEENLEGSSASERGGEGGSARNLSRSISKKLAAPDDEDEFVRRKTHKKELGEAVVKFNMGPKKGIKYLVETGKVDGSPGSIAAFLRTTEGLDKVKVGDYLGEGDKFNIEVLYAYVDMLDFKEHGFDDAIRVFLSGFRLPGEAQKIDRMMEKFAERYCKDNPGVFASADTAYVLAYSVIMLNTDAHNPQIQKKMTKAEFVRNNRGINDSGDLPQEFLEELYDRIVKNEIKMKDEDEDPSAASPALKKKGGALFHDEVQSMVVKTQAAMKRKTKQKATYYGATSVEHVRPMFHTTWCPVLAALSVNLEEAAGETEGTLVALALDGFRHAIRISAFFFMETERDAFVSSLAKFTYLQSRSVMRQKNIEAIKVLITIANADGNYLMTSWGLVLQSISQLERLQLIGMGATSNVLAGGPKESAAAGSVRDVRASMDRRPGALFGSSAKERPSVDATNAQNILEEIDIQALDRIFSRSVDLSSDAVVEFVRHLCAVAEEEIYNPANPRVFSLQKIVEVAHYNMERIRIVWSKIWMHLGEFFRRVACHGNLSIAMYAIDSLRQLSMKFLAKDELANYQFQKEFLRPFEQIMAESQSPEIRELIIRCAATMIQTLIVNRQLSNLKSGWKSIFALFGAGAGDAQEAIVQVSFEVVERVMREHAGLVMPDFFVDAVNCLTAFGANRLATSIALKSIDHIRAAAARLADGSVLESASSSLASAPSHAHDGPGAGPHSAPSSPAAALPPHRQPAEVHIKHWFPVLLGLARLVQDPRSAVRARALEALFGVLKQHGPLFAPPLWELVFRGVLIPIFDDVRHPRPPAAGAPPREDTEWVKTTCFAALQALTELFGLFFDVLGRPPCTLLHELLDLLKACVVQESEGLARIGVTCLSQLISHTGHRFSPAVWTTVCAALQELFDVTTPRQLFAIAPAPLPEEEDAEAASPDASPAAPPARRPEAAPSSPRSEAATNSGRQLATAGSAGVGAAGAGEGAGAAVDFKDIRCKCIVQLLLIQAVNDMVGKHYAALQIAHLETLLDALAHSFAFARSFNQNMDLRVSLWRAGFMNQVPNLLKQEGNGTSCCLRILFRMYAEKEPSMADRPGVAEPRLIALCQEVVRAYAGRSGEAAAGPAAAAAGAAGRGVVPEQQREMMAMTPILSLVLRGFLHFDSEQFVRHLPLFYDAFADLVPSDSLEIRQVLRDLFAQRIGPLLQLAGLLPQTSAAIL